jgi:hypothetical protein
LTRHLTDIREDIEFIQRPNIALAEYLFDPDNVLPYVLEQSSAVLNDLDQNFAAFLKYQLGSDDD